MPQPLRVFLSYAHEDDEYRVRLEKALKLMERQRLVESWSDRKLLPGQSWAESIDEQLERADLILLLVSDDFIASDYCWGVEVKRALERHEQDVATVVPILVRAAAWEEAPFGKLQALPTDARPVTSWPNEDEAWRDVARGLRRLIEQAQARLPEVEAGGPPDPRRYLEALEAAHSTVEIRGMGAKVAERLPLDRVYTRLRVAASRADPEGGPSARRKAAAGLGGVEGRLEEVRSLDLREVLPGHPHAVIIGDPGSGKTTFLRFAAQILARAQLGASGLAERRLGLDGAPPFPIFVRLSRFAEYLANGRDPGARVPEEAPQHFFDYLAHTLEGHLYGLASEYLGSRVREGGCYLLLDGLDEVPDRLRERVARIVEAVIREAGAVNRHLVTCRTRAYEGMTQLADLESFRLAPFESAQIEAFVAAWARALFRVGPGDRESPAAGEAESYRESLLEAMRSHPNVGPLTENPLMLTMLAVVHWNRKRLPEQRADLYEEAVAYLLESRKEQSTYAATLRREALQVLALRMFEDHEGAQRSLGRMEAADAVAGVLATDRQRALEFLENESLHSGLLVSRTEGEVEFWHLTFQEYLAALELAMGGEYWEGIEKRIHDDRWGEVVLLLGGCLRRAGGLRAARKFVEKILGTGTDRVSRARAVGLVGRILRDIAPYGGDPAAGTGYSEALEATLAIFDPGVGESVSENVRLEVGEALGAAGDPRLVHPASNRVAIAGGTFPMGAQAKDAESPGFDPEADDDEAPVHAVTLDSYEIGRYPVTVQEYREFFEAGGYADPTLWQPTGWAWREKEAISEPRDWESQLRHPNRPVTGVSWFEADAYCRWVSGRLPTEAEWEFAARGKDGRRYPWEGDPNPDDDHANFAMSVGHPTPVGIYPLGGTPEGVQDLAGNVLEWCEDWFGRYAENPVKNPGGPVRGDYRVLRGGSFYDDPRNLRGACRFSFHPVFRDGNFGFRVVWSSSGGLA